MFIKNSFFNSLPELLNIFLKFIVGLITAKLLGPQDFGIAAAIGLIFTYSVLLQLGASDGMALKVFSLNRESGMYAKLKHIYINSSFTFVNSILLIAAILLLGILGMFYSFNHIIWMGIFANILAAFLYQYFVFAQFNARFNYNFKAIAIVQSADYIFKALTTIILVYYYGLLGFFIGLALGYLFGTLFAHKYLRPNFELSLSSKYLKKVLDLGFPLLIIGAILTLFQSIDRWFILNSMSSTELGNFTLIFTFSTLILVIPIRIISMLIQYFREYFYRTKDNTTIHYAFVELLYLFIASNTIIILITKEIVFYLCKYYLLDYQKSYDIVNPIFCVSYFIGSFHLLSAYFTIIDKKRYSIISIISALVFSILFNYIAIYLYNSLYSIALATFASSFALCIIMFYYFLLEESPKEKKNFIFFFSILFILIYCTFSFLPLHYFDSILIDNLRISITSMLMIILIVLILVTYIHKSKIYNLRRILEN